MVCPPTLMYQWRNFISQFTGGTFEPAMGEWYGGADCITVLGRTPDQRFKQYERIVKERPTYCIISYNQVVNDYEYVGKLPWDFGIADEATFIKGFDSDRSQALKSIRPEFRYALTGDPVENAPEDLFSIMEWVDPSVLGDWDDFDRFYCIRSPQGWMVKARNLDVLHEVMSNAEAWYIKKADDPDVAPFMPVRHPPEVIRVRLDDAAADVYVKVANELLADLEDMSRSGQGGIDIAAMYAGSKGAKSAHGKAAAKLMALRLLCAGPYALRRSGLKYLAAPDKPKKLTTITRRDGQRFKVMKAPPKPGSAYIAGLLESGLIAKDVLDVHPKIEAAIARLDAILDENPKNKIVVFSFFKDVLDYLAASFLDECVIHNGDMSAKKKDEAKRQFQTDPTIRLFLSSDSGAYGVDLPQANYLLNYDIPFSAGPKRQRDARVVRGSSLDFWTHVQIIDLLVEDSIEEHYYDKTQRRIALGAAIKSGKRSTAEVTMTASSLTEFLTTHAI